MNLWYFWLSAHIPVSENRCRSIFIPRHFFLSSVHRKMNQIQRRTRAYLHFIKMIDKCVKKVFLRRAAHFHNNGARVKWQKAAGGPLCGGIFGAASTSSRYILDAVLCVVYKFVAEAAERALFTPLMESAIPISLNTSRRRRQQQRASFFIWRCNWWGKMLLVFEQPEMPKLVPESAGIKKKRRWMSDGCAN